MLSKLLSNISGGNVTSGEEVLGGNNEEGEGSSKAVFKSLLLSLQDQSSSGKVRQQLLGLSDTSSESAEIVEEEGIQKNVLGGSFTATGEADAENLQQVDHTILKELQKEFQNIKSQLTGDTSETPSEDETKVQDQKGKTESSDGQLVEESKVDTKENTNDSNGSKTPMSKDLGSNMVEGSGKQVEENGELKKTSNQKTSSKQESGAKGNIDKPVLENSKGIKNEKAESVNKEVVTDIDGSDENVKGNEGNSQKHKERTESAVSNNKTELAPEKKEVFSKPNGSFDKKEGGQQNSVPNLGDVEVTGKEKAESAEQSSQKKDSSPPKGTIDSRGKSFEKAQGFADRAMQPDAMKQTNEGQKVKDQSAKPGKTQAGVQLEGGQTVKTELTEQQKKVVDPFFQKNNASTISTKGLEMKSVQQEKGKNTKGKNEAENSKQGLGKESSEGRNKLLSRLGISSVNAQKQAKPLEVQNFSGISVGEANPSLEEQKISWEEQLSKTMDSSSDKESKASSVRLGQMPITNASLRKRILPGLTQRIQQAASSSKGDSSNWQKHNFTLDDGKNIQLSVRESKGVLQVKMGSMNLDLSKLLQQNLQQIREHLRQEFGSEVDLQFENQQQGEESQFSEDTESSDRKRNYRNNFGTKGVTVETAEEIRTKTVRNFGYNQMEWTA